MAACKIGTKANDKHKIKDKVKTLVFLLRSCAFIYTF